MKSRKTEGASSGVWFKGFMIFLLVIIVVLSLGLTIFYFMHETEDLYLDKTIINTNLDDEFEISIVHTNPEASTTFELQYPEKYLEKLSVSEDKLTYKFKTIEASLAGVSIVLTSSNSKFTSNMSCLVTIANGSNTNPFLIRNGKELAQIGVSESRPLSASYKQINDIDLSSFASWTPIANGLSSKFSGVYNGNYFSISNLKISENETSSSLGYAGLFGFVSGSVMNLKLVDANVVSKAHYVGLVAGCSEGTILRVEATGSINQTITTSSILGDCAMGGIVGLVNRNGGDTKVDRCSFTGTLTKTGNFDSYSNIGGLVGRNVGGTVFNSYAKTEVVSSANKIYAGGLIGFNRYSEETKAQGKDDSDNYKCKTNMKGNIVNAYSIFNAVEMSGSEVVKGAVVGYNLNVDETEQHNFVDDPAKNVNRFIGVYYLKDDSHTVPWKSGTDDVETFISGVNATALKTQTTYKTFEAAADIKVKVDAYWDFDKVWAISESVNYGYPTLQFNSENINPTIYDPNTTVVSNEITTAEQLYAIRNDLTEDYILAGNINLSSYDWIPIGTEDNPFTGSLKTKDGANYSISNLKIVSGSYDCVGLFGAISQSATLSGFTISGANITVGKKVGAIVGSCSGTINGVTVEGSINISNNESANFGMAVAELTDTGFILNVETRGSITIASSGDTEVTTNVGGVVAVNNGTVKSVSSKVAISVSSSSENVIVYAGGIVGYNSSNISYAKRFDGVSIQITGKVAKSAVGGIAGVNRGNISESVVTAVSILANNIGEQSYAGGICGINEEDGNIKLTEIKAGSIDAQNVGGLVGRNDSTDLETKAITCSMVDSEVALSGYRVAGLVAIMNKGEINNCATFANLNGKNMSGYASFIEKPARVTLCFSAVKFNLDAGKGFAATESEVFQEEWSILGFAGGGKVAGYLEKTVYDKDLANGTEVKHSSKVTIFGDHGNPDDGARTHDECIAAKTYTNRGFMIDLWKIVDGSYPTIKNIPEL